MYDEFEDTFTEKPTDPTGPLLTAVVAAALITTGVRNIKRPVLLTSLLLGTGAYFLWKAVVEASPRCELLRNKKKLSEYED